MIPLFFVEAKQAALVAQEELKVVAGDYDRTSHKLKELLQRVPAKVKTEGMASDMRMKEAEVDLGYVVLKEAITSAVVMEGYDEAIKDSRDKLQK